MQCSACGFENRENAKFCKMCGQKLELKCPSCGNAYQPDSQFCDECGRALQEKKKQPPPVAYTSPKAYTPKYLADKILTTRDHIEGERKLVTILAADVARYTAISEKLDLENVHCIMEDCFKILMVEVHRYEGIINQFLGDTTNIAFLLEQKAEPGQVLISEKVHNHVQGYFNCKALGEEKLKNRTHKVTYFALRDEKKKRSRLEIEAEKHALTGFVNREKELSEINDLYGKVKKNRGQVLCIVGDAGRGKNQ